MTDTVYDKIKEQSKTLNDSLAIKSMDQSNPKNVNWMWPGKIAYGKTTLFAGEPGVGKSQLLLYISSIVSYGGTFHFENKKCRKGKVLLIAGEDNDEDTIKPRLMALSADCKNIDLCQGKPAIDKNGNPYFGCISIVEDLHLMEETIKKEQYSLIIIDPISMYLGSVDENKNKEIRHALGMLDALAMRHNCAIILNSHFNKGGKNAIGRIMGSVGFAGASRVVYGIMKDTENKEEDKRLFIPIKNNLADDKEGYVYQVKPVTVRNCVENISTCRVEWLPEKTSTTADEILSASSVSLETPKLDAAKEFLLEVLKDGSKLLVEIRKEANEKKISAGILYKAKEVLKINEEYSYSKRGCKIWMLSPQSPEK